AGTLGDELKPANIQLDAVNRFQNEQRSVEFMRLTAPLAGPIEPPAPEALAAYFDQRKPLFRAPEYRKLTYVVVNPETLAKTTPVSDDE
ncbi:UNVERIFIED_CONTAM: peptidylprolyl isomerase, partial [Bacteroidetes bacterium 56_B9]